MAHTTLTKSRLPDENKGKTPVTYYIPTLSLSQVCPKIGGWKRRIAVEGALVTTGCYLSAMG